MHTPARTSMNKFTPISGSRPAEERSIQLPNAPPKKKKLTTKRTTLMILFIVTLLYGAGSNHFGLLVKLDQKHNKKSETKHYA